MKKSDLVDIRLNLETYRMLIEKEIARLNKDGFTKILVDIMKDSNTRLLTSINNQIEVLTKEIGDAHR